MSDVQKTVQKVLGSQTSKFLVRWLSLSILML